MTPEQHNKYLSWAHFGYAAINGLLMLVVLGFMTAAMSLDPKGPPPAFIFFMWAFIGGMFAVMTLPSVVAGYALRKRKRYAKIASMIAGVTASMQAPFGTAVCVYTFWFLFSESGKAMYDNPQRMLPEQRYAPWTTANKTAEREKQYAPPSSPPDWR